MGQEEVEKMAIEKKRLQAALPSYNTDRTGVSLVNTSLPCMPDEKKSLEALLIFLSRITSTVSGSNDLDSVLREGLGIVLKFIGGNCGGVMLLDDLNQRLTYHIHRGFSHDFARKFSLKPCEGINGNVASTGKAVLLDDISEEPNVLHAELIRKEGLRAFISVPLRFRGRVLGVLNCGSFRKQQFAENDMYLLNTIGDLLGMAIGHFRLHKRLQENREKYRDVARQVITVQEREKKRISQELHDETSQMLAALTLQLKTLSGMAGMIGLQDQKFMQMLGKVHDTAVQINDEVNHIISDLRPTLLDSLGFIPAIRYYAEANLMPLDINVSFDIIENPGVFSPEDEINLFRWVQGIIGNIVQHSRARNVSISLQKNNGCLELCIRDDGIGFDVSDIGQINTRKKRHGLGLIIAKERLKLIGGNCSVQSQPGKGTTVVAVIPLT